MWVAYVSIRTHEASLPPDCTYVIRVRYANDSASESRVKGGFQGCDITIFPGHRYYFLILRFTIRVSYVKSKRNTAYRYGSFKFITICRYNIISINHDNIV